MGNVVIYCAKCGERLREEDIKAGRGHQVLNRWSCTRCLEDVINSLPPADQAEYRNSKLAPPTPSKLRPVTPAAPLRPPTPVPQSQTAARLKTPPPRIDSPPPRRTGASHARGGTKHARQAKSSSKTGIIVLVVMTILGVVALALVLTLKK